MFKQDDYFRVIDGIVTFKITPHPQEQFPQEKIFLPIAMTKKIQGENETQIEQNGSLEGFESQSQTLISETQTKEMKLLKKNGKSRTDQNYNRGFSRKLLTLLEKTHTIQPDFNRNTPVLEQLAFILILIRIVPEKKRHGLLSKLFQEIVHEFEAKGSENDGIQKQLALIDVIVNEVDLSDKMNINENMLKMRNAGKARIVKKLHQNDQAARVLELEEELRPRLQPKN